MLPPKRILPRLAHRNLQIPRILAVARITSTSTVFRRWRFNRYLRAKRSRTNLPFSRVLATLLYWTLMTMRHQSIRSPQAVVVFILMLSRGLTTLSGRTSLISFRKSTFSAMRPINPPNSRIKNSQKKLNKRSAPLCDTLPTRNKRRSTDCAGDATSQVTSSVTAQRKWRWAASTVWEHTHALIAVSFYASTATNRVIWARTAKWDQSGATAVVRMGIDRTSVGCSLCASSKTTHTTSTQYII